MKATGRLEGRIANAQRAGDSANLRRPVVLFDWGETLVRIPGMVHDPAAHLACARAAFRAVVAPRFAASRRALDEDRFMAAYERAAYEQMQRSRDTLREHRFEDRLHLALGFEGAAGVLGTADAGAFARHLGDHVLQGLRLVDPDVPGIIRRLHRRYRLGIVSNYPYGPVVTGSLALLGLADAFDAVIVSGEVGWCKPHREIFQVAAAAMAADPATTAFVGDNAQADMQGAKGMGMRTAWYAPGCAQHKPAEADVHLDRFAELERWCEEVL